MITTAQPSTIVVGDAGTPAMLQRLLVALDDTSGSSPLLEFAVALAVRHGSEIVFCNAVDHAGAIAECSTGSGASLLLPLVEALDDASTSLLANAVAVAAAAGVIASGIELDGRPVSAILACALAHGVDAIVLATAGRRGLGRAMLGSTADGVLRGSSVPVVVLPPRASAAHGFARILDAVDESEPSGAAATFAAALARIEHARLALCAVVDAQQAMAVAAEQGLDAVALLAEMRLGAEHHAAAESRRIGGDPARTESLVVVGEPTDALLQAAAARSADCIVVGSHGRSGLRRLFLGSVAEGLVRRSRVPVVIVHGPGARGPAAHAPHESREQVRA